MPIAGRKPKANPRNRVPPVHDWVELADVPFVGAPRLPARGARRRWPTATRRWWAALSTMPHCVLWTESDWAYAFDTAELHARFVEGGDSAQVRMREKVLGTTVDARRDLRIRYLAPPPDEPTEAQPAPVSQLDDYRDLYGA